MNEEDRKTAADFRRLRAANHSQAEAIRMLSQSENLSLPSIRKRLRRAGLTLTLARRHSKRWTASPVPQVRAIVEPVGGFVRVDREPCARCGVRSDVGCGHRPARLGTSL